MKAIEKVQKTREYLDCLEEHILNVKKAWEEIQEKCKDMRYWESWTGRNFVNPNMWEVHCAHMVIDWVAMGYKLGDTAQEYYGANADSIRIPEYAKSFIYEVFDRLYPPPVV